MKPKDIWIYAILVLICLVSFALKMAMVFSTPAISAGTIFMPDSTSYISPAEALLKTGHFFTTWKNPDSPETMRTPGYPVFLALIFLLFGQNYPLVIIIQALLSIITIILTYLIARQFLDEKKSLIPAIIIALDPVSFTFSSILLSETLFTILFISFVYSAARLLNRKSASVYWAALAGLFLALTTLTRPLTSYLFIILFIVYLIYSQIQKIPTRIQTRILLAFSLPWMIFVVGWQLRNYQLSGSFRLSDIEPINLLTYRAAGIIAIKDNIPLSQAQEKVLALLPARNNNSNTDDSYTDYYKVSFSIIANNPFLFIRSQLTGLAKIMMDSGSDDLLTLAGISEPSGPYSDLRTMPINQLISKWLQKPVYITAFILSNLYLFAIYFFSFWGLYIIFRNNPTGSIGQAIFLVGLVIYFISFSAGPESDARFRLPIIPILAVFAGFGYSQIIKPHRTFEK